MGRWAQRSIRGGGPQTVPFSALIQMSVANISGVLTADVTWSDDLDVTNFNTSDFASQPSSESALIITPVSTNAAIIQFSGSITTDTTLDYTGSVPGVQTPQTIAYT